MRRYLILIAAAGSLLLGCSSSGESSSASSTTTSSVVITPANQKVCADLKAFSSGLENSGFKTGATQAETAAAVQTLFNQVTPLLETVKVSAPPDLAPAIEVYTVQFAQAKTLDPADADDQQKLMSMLLAPEPDLRDAQKTLTTWSAQNCGLDLPGS